MRRAGLETVERVGFPSLKQEPWKYTNVKPIAEAGFPRASAVSPAVELTEDMLANAKDDIQELIKKSEGEIESGLDAKEKEILQG